MEHQWDLPNHHGYPQVVGYHHAPVGYVTASTSTMDFDAPSPRHHQHNSRQQQHHSQQQQPPQPQQRFLLHHDMSGLPLMDYAGAVSLPYVPYGAYSAPEQSTPPRHHSNPTQGGPPQAERDDSPMVGVCAQHSPVAIHWRWQTLRQTFWSSN